MKCLGCLFGSVFAGLFAGLTIGAVALAIFPKSAYIMRPLACDGDETISHIEYTTTTTDGQGTSYTYFCKTGSQSREVTGTVIVSYMVLWGAVSGGFIYGIWLLFSLRRAVFGTTESNIQLPPDFYVTGGQPVTLALANAQLTIPAQAWAEIQRCLINRNKIGAIKALREATGLGLKESKDLLEAIQRSPQHDFEASPSPSPAPVLDSAQVTISPEAASEIQRLVTMGNKIGAIKAMREATGLGLKEAKDLVESIQRSPHDLSEQISNQPQPTSRTTSQSGLSSEVTSAIQRCLADGNKIKAIKLLREATGMALKDAKDMVEAMQRGMHDFGISDF